MPHTELYILCTFVFALRVVGHALVRQKSPSWLPSHEHWMSGRVPYRYLLIWQLSILVAMVWTSHSIWTGNGLFARPFWQDWAGFFQGFAYLYFGSMVFRYVHTMATKPERRWFKRTIPLWFHMVLALAWFLFADYHGA